MLEILQEKNRNKIVLIKTGVFYTATGKDAIFLNKVFELKCICFKKGICKVGIPESRLEYYLRKLEKLNIAYIVYNFDNQHERLIVKHEKDGVYHKEKEDNRNCLICKGIRCYKEDKYIKALKKLLQKEKGIEKK